VPGSSVSDIPVAPRSTGSPARAIRTRSTSRWHACPVWTSRSRA
jgi:hypothetical protein